VPWTPSEPLGSAHSEHGTPRFGVTPHLRHERVSIRKPLLVAEAREQLDAERGRVVLGMS